MGLFSQFVFMLFGYILITTGLSKLKNTAKHYSIVYAYNILPKKYISYFVFLDTTIELIIGFSLVAGIGLVYMIPSAISLLLIYTFAILINLLRGVTEIDCGCGGAVGEHTLSYSLIIRNSIITIFLIILYIMNYFHFESLIKSEYLFNINYFLLHSILPLVILVLYLKNDLQSIQKHLEKI